MRMMKYLAAVGLVLAVAGTAGATTTPIPFTHAYNGPVTMHITSRDMGTLYPPANVPPGNGTLLRDGVANVNSIAGQFLYPGAGASTDVYYDTNGFSYTFSGGVWKNSTGAVVSKPVDLEDGWGIFTVDSITPAANQFDILWQPGVGGIQLVGMYYGGVDNAVVKDTSKQTTIQVQDVRYDIWSQAYNPLYVLGAGGSQDRTAANAYTGITGGSGTLQLAGVSAQGLTAPIEDALGNVSVNSPEFISIFTPDLTLFAGSGTFSSYLDLTSGASMFMWDTNQVGVGNDMFIQGSTATKDADLPGNWMLKNRDPIDAYVVPEPLTMLGVFLGISGLGGYIRRRMA